MYGSFALNPFLSTTQFHTLSSPTHFFPEVIVNDSAKVFTIGVNQYSTFKESCFIKGIANIDEKLKKNQLKLPKDRLNTAEYSPYTKLTNSAIVKLRDACYSRQDLVREMFKLESTGVPECFYDPKKNQMYHSSKSNVVKLLTTSNRDMSKGANIPSSGLVIDLSVIVRIEGSTLSTQNSTFQNFIDSIINQILSLGKKVNAHRIDVVEDTYMIL